MKLRDQLEDLEHLADQEIKVSEKPSFTDIISFWPFLRALLIAFKLIGGSKTDSRIDQIIWWGDGVTGFIAPFVKTPGLFQRIGNIFRLFRKL